MRRFVYQIFILWSAGCSQILHNYITDLDKYYVRYIQQAFILQCIKWRMCDQLTISGFLEALRFIIITVVVGDYTYLNTSV